MGYTEEEWKKRNIEDREDKIKGAGTKARSRRKRRRKSIESWKIRTASERMTTEVKTGLHVVYRFSYQRLRDITVVMLLQTRKSL